MADLRLQVVLDLAAKATAPLRRITQGSADAARALKAARDTLKGLNDQQKAMDGLQRQQAAMREAGNQVRVLTQNLDALRHTEGASQRQIAAVEKSLAKATGACERQRNATFRLRQQLTALGVGKLSDAQAQLKTTTQQATDEVRKQEAAVKAQIQQHERLAALKERHGKEMLRTGMLAGAGVAGMTAGRALSRPVIASMTAFSAQESASSQLRAAMMQADGSVSGEFKDIEALAIRLGDRLPGSTTDFIDMMAMLKKQGLSAQSILGGTGQAASYLGVQLQMSAAEAAEFAAKLQDTTRTTERDMMGLMDVIQRTYYLGVGKENMLAGFTKMSPVLNVIKQEGLEGAKALAPLLVMMDQTGMAGEAAGNAIRKVFQSTLDAKRLDKANDALKDAGAAFRLNFVNDKGLFAGIEQLFAQIQKIKGIGNDMQRTSVIKALFGDDAETLQVLDTLMSKDLAGYREVQAKLQAQADLRLRVDAQLKTLSNLWEAVTGSFTNILASVGEAVADDVKGLVTWLNGATGAVRNFVAEHPALIAFLVKTVAVIAALTWGVGALMLALASLLGPFFVMRFLLARMGLQLLPLLKGAAMLAGNALLWLGKIVWVAGRLLLLNPIGLAITAIATAVYLIYRHWGPITAFFQSLWTSITAGLRGLWQTFTSMGAMLMDGLVGGITSRLAAVREAITGAASAAIGWFRETLGIRSPSRVFMAAGEHLGEGAAIGIARSASLVRRAAVGMAAAGALGAPALAGTAATAPALDLRPPLTRAAMAPGAAVGGDQVTIHVHAAPGMDEKALARLVAAELDRRDRAKAARRQSSLHDID